jgi:hypothetical protein
MERKMILYQKFSINWPDIVAGSLAVRGRWRDVTLRSVTVVASFCFSYNAKIRKLFAKLTRLIVLTFEHALCIRKLDTSGCRVPLFRAPTFLQGKTTSLQSEYIYENKCARARSKSCMLETRSCLL